MAGSATTNRPIIRPAFRSLFRLVTVNASVTIIALRDETDHSRIVAGGSKIADRRDQLAEKRAALGLPSVTQIASARAQPSSDPAFRLRQSAAPGFLALSLRRHATLLR